MSYTFPKFDTDYDGYIHAIGRIIACWNGLENIMDVLLLHCGVSPEESEVLQAKLNNSMKVLFIKTAYRKIENTRPSQTGNLEHFLKLFGLCAANRNFYAHAIFTKDSKGPRFSKKSEGKVGTTNTIRPTLREVQKVSEQFEEITQYGAHLLLRLRFADDKGFIASTAPTQLFAGQKPRPSLPKTWDLHPTRETHP